MRFSRYYILTKYSQFFAIRCSLFKFVAFRTYLVTYKINSVYKISNGKGDLILIENKFKLSYHKLLQNAFK